MFAASLLVLNPTAASADLSVQGLVKQCEGLEPDATRPIIGKLMCLGYISGALDQLILADTIPLDTNISRTPTLCLPENVVKIEQLSEVVQKLSKDKPEIQSETARSILRRIIFELYKCK